MKPRCVDLGLAVLLLGCGSCGGSDAAREWGPRPDQLPVPEGDVHVVLYLVDTLRADRLGLYGYHRPTSPHLDALAEECVVFDSAYAAAPWTLPSVVSMMTASFPMEHGIVVRGDRVAEEAETLPERMQALGYRTAGFVCNPFGATASGMDEGYDHLVSMPRGRQSVDVAEVQEWLRAHPDDRHFLYVHTLEPHRPYKAPRGYQERFGDPGKPVLDAVHEDMKVMRTRSRADFDAGREVGTTQNDAEQQVAIDALAARKQAVDAYYDAGVAWADGNVQALVQLLRKRGMWDRTLFLFLSDHGEELFDHGGWLHTQHLYGELVHVPFLVHFPGGARPVERCAAPVTLVDVLPSILDYLGEDPGETSGESLLPKLVDGAPSEPRVVANRVNRMLHFGPDVRRRGNVNVAVVQGSWKAILNLDVDTIELYDLAADPGEQDDLAGREPDKAAALRAVAEQWLRDRRTPGVSGRGAELEGDVLDELRELGYAR